MILDSFHHFFRDVRIGARMLAKTPLFTLFAVLILAIAIGANITIFSFVTAIFARPLAIPEPDRFVRLYTHDSPGGDTPVSDYRQYRDQAQSLASIGGYNSHSCCGAVRVDGPATIPLGEFFATLVEGSLFEAIGLPAELGRPLSAMDESGGQAVVVLSDECWTRYFGRDPHVLGRRIFITQGAVPFTIVGVMPPAFSDVFRVNPDGWDISRFGPPMKGPLLFFPWYRPDPRLNPGETVSLVGRLKPGVIRTAAQADLSRIAAQLSATKRRSVSIDLVSGNTPTPVLKAQFALFAALLLGAVAVVLMIACDDIAILLLAKMTSRRREVGIRLALGASRTQIIRQFIAENLILSALAGLGAMIVALGATRIIERLPLPVPMPDAFHLTFGWRVVVFATLLSLAATVFFGMRPALHGVKRDVAISLNPGSSPGDPGHSAVRAKLVIAHVTVCTALLITAAVLVRSARTTELTEQSGITKKVVTTRFTFQGTPYDGGNSFDFYRKLLARIDGIPGVVSASVAEVTPVPELGGSAAGAGMLTVLGDRSNEEFQIKTNNVSWGFFETVGMRLVDGGDFTPNDGLDSRKVCILTQAAQRLVFPEENPIGHSLRLKDGSSVEVVGVAKDIKYTMDQAVEPFVYRPLAQNQRLFKSILMVRGRGDIAQTSSIVQAKIAEVDPNLLAKTGAMDDEVQLLLLPNEIGTYIAGVPGVMAFLLGLIGTYGTMSLLVAQRRTEIGVRIALGARPSQAVWLMLRQGMQWTIAGLALGILGAGILTFGMSRYFYGMASFDFSAFVLSVGAIAFIASIACYIPAKRASGVDPMQVLRHE
jgi:predicted permease